jgi:hypothetical protein
MGANKRVWAPLAGAAACLVATTWTGPILTWVLLAVAAVLLFDFATLVWSRGASNLGEHRQ